MVECKICNQNFENSKQLISHLKSHNIDYQTYLKTYVYKPFLYYNIQIKPGICPICGNSIKLTGFKLKKFCCHKCANEFMKSEAFISEIDKKRRQTCVKKYGVENYRNIEKSKETKLKKYGDSNYNNRTQAKQTCIDLYGVENPFQSGLIKEKIKETNLKKYGFESHNQNESVKNKVKESILKKFGTEVYTQSDDYKSKKAEIIKKKEQTCIDLYGVDNPCKNKKIIEKMIKTNNEKYGANSAMQTPDFKATLKQIQASEAVKRKKYETHKRNNSFNTSAPEKKLLEILQNKFGASDIEYQYRSPKYPYNCDFYIKSLDLYIELQGSWIHGKAPYDPKNPDHIKKLQEWQEKSQTSQFYRNAIDVWTRADVEKRKLAKENGIKLIEVFDSDSFSEIDFLIN